MIDPEVHSRFETELGVRGLNVTTVDNDRPWGGEFIFDDSQVDRFIEAFFPSRKPDRARLSMPKLLVVAPRHRLSWQYHHRRGEIWHVLAGPVGLTRSPTDEQPPVTQLETGESVEFGSHIRHRLGATDCWGAVAELWLHDDVEHPSDEADIVRITDDYHRD